MENHDSKGSRPSEQWRKYEESQTTVAAIFGGIAALFIAGIAAAFIYAKDTNPTQTASIPARPATSAAQIPQASTAPKAATAPETTGSGATHSTAPKPSGDDEKGQQ